LVSPLQIHILSGSDDLVQSLQNGLDQARYTVYHTTGVKDCLHWLASHRDQLDCLVIDSTLTHDELLQGLTDWGVLIPTVIIVMEDECPEHLPEHHISTPISDWQRFKAEYHKAVVTSPPPSHPDQIARSIRQAIQQFLDLPPDSCALPQQTSIDQLPTPNPLSTQQERLTDKLKARLGYLGVYYKRNPENFLRNMRQADRKELFRTLKATYRSIILGYFSKDSKLNQKIDDFVNQAFMADISVSHIVEIHMELMDEFSKQLQLEGRSEEILLDYRLTLIDVIAHLCEMYRRSIPREP
jgi:circadian clock protein KaiA